MSNRSTLLTPMHPISLSIVEPASGKGSLGRCTSLLLCIVLFFWRGQAYAEPVDTITFSDGEQLAGKLVSILGGTVTFHSEILGNVTVPLAKVKTLNTVQPFAVVEKNKPLSRESAVGKIPVGNISLENRSFLISPPQAAGKSVPVAQIGSVIDATTFHRELHGESDFLYGWTGSVTLGVSLVEATKSAQT